MSKNLETYREILNHLRLARRKREDRYALQFNISKLESIYNNSSFRREVAMALRPLISMYETKNFTTLNGDMFVITGQVPKASLETAIQNVYKVYKNSAFIANLTPEAFVDDSFVTWFPLETEADAFDTYIQALISFTSQGKDCSVVPVTKSAQAQKPVPAEKKEATKPTSPMLASTQQETTPPKKTEKPVTVIGPEKVIQLADALRRTDISGFVQHKNIISQKPKSTDSTAPLMRQHYLSIDTVIQQLLIDGPVDINPYLKGYLTDMVSTRIFSVVKEKGSSDKILNSIRTTARAVISIAFDEFDKELNTKPRNQYIIELPINDAFTDPKTFSKAVRRIRDKGFQLQLGEIDWRAFGWLSRHACDADFVRVNASDDSQYAWNGINDEDTNAFSRAIQAFGTDRVILDKCFTPDHMHAAKWVGITLFVTK